MSEYSEEAKADMVTPYVDGIERNARAFYMRYVLDNCLMAAVLPGRTRIDPTKPPSEVGFFFGRYQCFEGAVRDTWTAHNEEQHEQQ